MKYILFILMCSWLSGSAQSGTYPDTVGCTDTARLNAWQRAPITVVPNNRPDTFWVPKGMRLDTSGKIVIFYCDTASYVVSSTLGESYTRSSFVSWMFAYEVTINDGVGPIHICWLDEKFWPLDKYYILPLKYH